LVAAVSAESTFELNPYVVDGSDANIVDYPWIVSLRVGGNHNCGGSILSSRFVLTAAHCSGDSIQYGASRISSTGPNVIRVNRIIRHEAYSSFTLVNDVAILELAEDIPLSPTAQAVKLAPRFYEVSGNWETAANLVGFGLDRTGGSIQVNLQEVGLLVASNEYCRSVHRNQVYDSMLCAGVPEGGKGQCSGDSGGPLTLENGWQVGIVSWSEKPCTIAPYPGVYTKVSHHIDWIESKTGLTFE